MHLASFKVFCIYVHVIVGATTRCTEEQVVNLRVWTYMQDTE